MGLSSHLEGIGRSKFRALPPGIPSRHPICHHFPKPQSRFRLTRPAKTKSPKMRALIAPSKGKSSASSPPWPTCALPATHGAASSPRMLVAVVGAGGSFGWLRNKPTQQFACAPPPAMILSLPSPHWAHCAASSSPHWEEAPLPAFHFAQFARPSSSPRILFFPRPSCCCTVRTPSALGRTPSNRRRGLRKAWAAPAPNSESIPRNHVSIRR